MKAHYNKESLIDISDLLQDDVLKDVILSTWKEYTNFIEKPGLSFPNNIVFKFFDYKKNPEIKENAHVINLNNGNFEFLIEQLFVRDKSTLYHEFTHIMDMIMLHHPGDIKEFDKMYSTITETRSDYISYMYDSGLKSISDKTLISSNSIIQSKHSSIGDCIQKESEKMTKYLSSLEPQNICHNKKSLADVIFVQKQLQYYLGFCLFIKKHTNIPINNTILLKATSIFGDKIYEIFEMCERIPLNMNDISENDIDFAIKYSALFKESYLYYWEQNKEFLKT